ncbi:hypothetical protein GCWU000341_01443 [Oribacterium sp. oral taxon 078 str. F0262]|nr:hypothetical protein GCWU000341_01443 [Oribacterium sp. oral taxon 078 str. F0262]
MRRGRREIDFYGGNGSAVFRIRILSVLRGGEVYGTARYG